MEFRNIKIRTPDVETNIAVQKYLIEKGCKWYNGTDVQRTHVKFLYVDPHGVILWGSDAAFFESELSSGEYKEVVIETEAAIVVKSMTLKERPKTLLFGKMYYTDELNARLAGLEVAK